MIVELNRAQKQRLIDLEIIPAAEDSSAIWKLNTISDSWSWYNQLAVVANEKTKRTYMINFFSPDSISLDELLAIK